ncbi:SDR family oxidoreductase [soil metagenome]
MKKTICILGFGYIATFLAERLSSLAFNITGTSRNQQRCEHYSSRGYRIVPFDAMNVEPLLQQATHLFIATPPCQTQGDPVLAYFLPLLEKHCRQWQWVGYASSTGVYGDHQGAWVDETANSQNPGLRGNLRLEAEMAWENIANKFSLPLHIFRLAGIYGPRRNAFNEILNGKTHSVYKDGQFFARIHVEDIIKIIVASIQKPNPGSIYNVADDLPASPHEVDQYATELLNRNPLPILPFEDTVLSLMAAEFYNNNRRVNNAKIKHEFKLELTYPSYKQGLLQLYQSKELTDKVILFRSLKLES